MKPAHTGHHPGAVPGFRPSPGNSEETTTRVLTEEISVLFRVPTWDPTHPGSPVSRALPGNTPTQGPTREGKPGFFLGGGGNPGRNPGHGLGKTRERGGFRVFPGWYCWGLHPHPAPTENFANSRRSGIFSAAALAQLPISQVLVGPMGWAVGFEFPGIHSDQNSDYWASKEAVFS